MNTSAHMSLWQRFRQWAAQPWLLWAYTQGCADERKRAQAFLWESRQPLPMTPISVPAVQQPEPESKPAPGFDLKRRQEACAKEIGISLPPPKPKPEQKKTHLSLDEKRELMRTILSGIETVPGPEPEIDPALVTLGDLPHIEPAQHNPLALTGVGADLFGTENDAWRARTVSAPTHALEELADLATMRHNSDTLEVPAYMRKKRAVKNEESE